MQTAFRLEQNFTALLCFGGKLLLFKSSNLSTSLEKLCSTTLTGLPGMNSIGTKLNT